MSMGRPHYSASQVMTGLCLWEAVLEIRNETDPISPPGAPTRDAKALDELFDAYGSFTMREATIRLIEDCDLAWDAGEAMGEQQMSFDFEWCDIFVRGALNDGRLEAVLRGTYGQGITWRIAG